jgi:ACR3 family arsenite efflux pump ArsB
MFHSDVLVSVPAWAAVLWTVLFMVISIGIGYVVRLIEENSTKQRRDWYEQHMDNIRRRRG